MLDITKNLNNFEQGHPLRVYLEENILIKELFEELFKSDIRKDFERFLNIFNKIGEVEKHFARKEDQLFPYLEKYNWINPSQNMWAVHNQIRAEIKDIRKTIEKRNYNNVFNDCINLFSSLTHLMQVEEQNLFPEAYKILSENDWKEMRLKEEEILE